MLPAVVALSAVLFILGLALKGLGKERRLLFRAFERERNQWANREAELLDRIMVLKGHREYAPVHFSTETNESETKDENIEWEEF